MTWSRRVLGALALACAAIGLVPAAASAADPGRWSVVGRETVPLNYFQGITSDSSVSPTTHGNLFFDGPSVGLYRTNAQLTEQASNASAIPANVSAAPPTGEGYNHLGDISYNSADGGRILLPLECYYPGTSGGSNTCKTGSIGVANTAGVWQYYVKLDDNFIAKTMWIESSDDGTKLYTQGGNKATGGANDNLLVYNAADVTAAKADTPGTATDPNPIAPDLVLTNVLPGGQMTGATFFNGRLYVAKSVSSSGPTDTFQVYSLDPNAGTSAQVLATRRLEIEIPVAGESEGLDVNPGFGSVLDWQIMPIPSSPATQPATYQPGSGSLISFVPKSSATDIYDADGDGVVDANDTCPATPGNLNNGCFAGTADPGDEDTDRINTNGVLTPPDNCPAVANNFQANADQDSQGDACDADDDNDTVADGSDNCQFVKNTDQLDTDGDGKGNVCEDDDDNDTVVDYYDNCPVTANTDQKDTDGDGIGDACESAPPPPADTTPPDTNIGKVKVKKNTATIVFATTDVTPGAYECKLDGKTVKGECKSPLKLKKLKPGKHKFEVAAVDAAGNVDPTPAKATLKVKKPKKKHKG